MRRGPDALRMGLYALHRVNDADRAIENGQASVDLKSEVLVTRSINQVNSLLLCSRGTVFSKWPVQSNGC